jgi:anti-sigma28 factor (negative regulator of flagellin synthesis)
MSIRIQNDSLAGTSASETSRTQDVVQIGSAGNRSGSKIGVATDRVELSSLSGRIADASSASETAQASRVQQLGALYSSGRYQPDSMATGRALVSQAIQSGSMGGD